MTAALLCGCLGGYSGYSQPSIPLAWIPFQDVAAGGDAGGFNNFSTSYGSLPSAFSSHLISVPVNLSDGFWWPSVLLTDSTNANPSYLQYFVIDSNFVQNVSLDIGTMYVCFAPHWMSSCLGGTGPAPSPDSGKSYLLCAGDFSSNAPNGRFEIYIDAGGNHLICGSLSNGVSTTYVSTPIAWSSNVFHQLGFEYKTTSSRRSPGTALYLDSGLAVTGGAVTVPALGIDTNTGFYTNIFCIGSDGSGYSQARGSFFNLVTWSSMYGGYYVDGWPSLSNSLAAWQATLDGGGLGALFGSRLPMSSLPPGYLDGVSYSSNYWDCSNFWMTAGTPNSPTNILVTLQNVKSNLTYVILTNSILDSISNWNVYQTLTATNAVIVAPPLNCGSNTFFLSAGLVWSTTTNGLPDFWQMEYFGNFLEPTNGCFDGDGVPDLQKYQTGADPNVITFQIGFTNQYVNLTNAPLTLGIQGGLPYNYAVLVDNTNFGGASWMPYTSSNITTYLGTNEGWHTVWVGLRGLPANAQQTWNSVTLDLDLTPPTMVITSPADGITVSVPVVQLQGFCPERLSSISYDLLNAAGLVTNQQALVVNQYYDMAQWAFTTNFFQAFDVPLTNGLNSFTFHAADLAGNVTVTNFSVTVDYSGKTNPPSVQVNWPQDGGIVCGNNLVCLGLVSDPTVAVVVEITDSFGDTNSVTADVGRDGDFYAENLPLTNGENDLTITVTDAAGNMTNITLTITQGESGLNIDAVLAGQTNVTGEIGSGDFTIWVNDVLVTNVVTNVSSSVTNYSWSAQIVPIGAGGGTVIAEAVPNSDQEDIAMRGFAIADITTPPPPEWNLALVPAPPGIYISGYQEFDQEQYVWPLSPGYRTGTNQFVWQDGQPGSATSIWDTAWGWDGLELCSWPATSWPQPPVGVVTNICLETLTTNISPYTLGPFPEEHCDISFVNPYLGAEYLQRTADTQIKLATGGMSGSTAMNLWLISCAATNYSLPWVPCEAAWYYGLSNSPVSPTNISIMGSPLDTSGILYVLLPDNTNMDPTPLVSGPGFTYCRYGVAATKTRLTYSCEATIPANRIRTNIGVGEYR